MKKTNLIIILISIVSVSFSQTNTQEKFEIFFNNNSAIIDKLSENIILKKIKTDSTSIITSVVIEAHCDTKGSNELNDALSQKRASSILYFLTSNSINQSIITQFSFGKRKLKYPIENDSLNRRAEITINYLKKDIKAKHTEIEVKPNEIVKQISDNKLTDNTKHIVDAKVGELIVFESIQFYPGQAVPLPKSLDVMQDIATILLENPTIEIEIQGHICCTSTDDDNISTKRAKCVYDYLVENGVNKNRLTYKGYGRSRPRTDESTSELTQMNRRVEIKITKK